MKKVIDVITDYCKEKKESLIKLLICILFFSFVLIFTRDNKDEIVNDLSKIKNEIDIEEESVLEETLENEEYYIELLNNLSNNNFDLVLKITKDKENKVLAVSRQTLNKEVLYIKENNNEEYYYKNNEDFYKLENENLVMTNYVDIFKYEIDMFYDMNNLVNLLTDLDRASLYLEDENSYYKYKFKLSDILNYYNSLHTSSIETEDNDVLICYVYFYNNINKVSFDLTSFYNLIYNTDYKNVEYEFTFSNVNTVDLSEIDDLV